MESVEVDPAGVRRMRDKGLSAFFKITFVRNPAANIIKQAMLSLGGDAAISYKALVQPGRRTDVVLIGSLAQIKKLPGKLKSQQFGLAEIAEELEGKLAGINYNIREFVCAAGKISFKKGPAIMGIINVTPDSFFDGGKYFNGDAAVEHALKLVKDGANIIDVGGESSRPGSNRISEKEEVKRVIPVIKKIKARTKVFISVDTGRASVARKALSAGASIINDISGMTFDPKMPGLAVRSGAGCIIMHMKGRPGTMQKRPQYNDLMGEISGFLEERARILVKAGVNKKSISIDPGIGFGKTVRQNYVILNRLEEFIALGYPVTVGVSRKSFIGQVTGAEPEERLPGTIAAEAISVFLGAHIIRAHDVKEAVQAVKVSWALRNCDGVKKV